MTFLMQSVIIYLSGLRERIRYSKSWLHYTLAALAGLALARLLYSIILYILVSAIPADTAADRVQQRSRQAGSVTGYDPTETIGGPLFQAAPVQQTENNKEVAVVQPDRQFKLLGTLEGHPSFARAVIQFLDGKDPTREFAIGSKIGNARLTWIGRGYIWIKKDGQKMKLRIGESTQEVAQKIKKAAAERKASATSGQVITRVISRDEVNSTLKGNAARIYKGASFGPNLTNGKIDGYKIHKVKPTHVFYKLGARPGDIIRKVNGYPLTDTERMFELWKSIKTAPSIKVDIERGGKILTYDFQIRN